MSSFATVAGLLGAMLMVGALLSGIAHRSMLALAPLVAIGGFVLGHGAIGVLRFDARSGFVSGLATAALVVILFRDGLEVEWELLRSHWRPPLRTLVIGMPLTAAIVALVARAAVGLSWTQSFLLGALLSPTDPILSSSVVTDPRVPRAVRHSINLESGLNDGLALPAVLVLAAALELGADHVSAGALVAEDIGFGFAIGLACGLVGSLLMPARRADEPSDGVPGAIPGHQRALYGLGIAFATYGATLLLPNGNGFIAVFVAAIVLGNRRADLRSDFAGGAGEIAEILKLGVFAVFGSLLTLSALGSAGWGGAAVVLATLLLARPVAVLVSLAGTRAGWETTAFIAWFGPKGIATITFSLLLLGDHIAAAQRIFDLTALVVLASIIVHGVSDTPGANWLVRRERERERRAALS